MTRIDPDRLPAHAVSAAVDLVAASDEARAFCSGLARVEIAAFIEALLADDDALKRASYGYSGCEHYFEAMRAALAFACQEDPA